MEILLNDINERLKAKVPALKYIDEDWGQLDYYSTNPPVKWPCSLSDVFEATFTNAGKLVQLGNTVVVIRLADLRLSNSQVKAPVNQKLNHISFFVLVKNVFTSLHGWAGHNHYSALVRVSQGRKKRDDGVREYEMRFATTIKDVSAIPQKLTIQRTGFDVDITTEIGKIETL